MYEYIHVWVQSCMNTFMYEYFHVWIHSCMNTFMYRYIHVWVYSCMGTFVSPWPEISIIVQPHLSSWKMSKNNEGKQQQQQYNKTVMDTLTTIEIPFNEKKYYFVKIWGEQKQRGISDTSPRIVKEVSLIYMATQVESEICPYSSYTEGRTSLIFCRVWGRPTLFSGCLCQKLYFGLALFAGIRANFACVNMYRSLTPFTIRVFVASMPLCLCTPHTWPYVVLFKLFVTMYGHRNIWLITTYKISDKLPVVHAVLLIIHIQYNINTLSI